MSQDQNKPTLPVIAVIIGEISAEGHLAGLSIEKVRKFIAANAPEVVIPPGSVARVTTMVTKDPTWQAIDCEEQMGMLMRTTPTGLQIMQGASKFVPETYVLRPDDVSLSFELPEASTPPLAP